MRRVVPFRRSSFRPRRTRAAGHGIVRPRTSTRKGQTRWFPIALVALPLAAFTAVLLLPFSGGTENAAATAIDRAGAEASRRTAAELDAAQPQVAAAGGYVAGGGARAAGGTDRDTARFALCTGGARTTCVVDGDTIWYRGEKVRISDLDAPEVFSPGCPREAAMGRRATARMQALLNEGPFTLAPDPDGATHDKYGRRLMRATRDGESIGAVLVREGLAEEWGGPRVNWC